MKLQKIAFFPLLILATVLSVSLNESVRRCIKFDVFHSQNADKEFIGLIGGAMRCSFYYANLDGSIVEVTVLTNCACKQLIAVQLVSLET